MDALLDLYKNTFGQNPATEDKKKKKKTNRK